MLKQWGNFPFVLPDPLHAGDGVANDRQLGSLFNSFARPTARKMSKYSFSAGSMWGVNRAGGSSHRGPLMRRDFHCQKLWRHQMETFYALLALCAGNSPITGEFPSKWPVTQSFGVFFDLRLDEQLSEQSWIWWFETPSRSLCRHCNVCVIILISASRFR